MLETIKEDVQTVFAKDPAAKTPWEVIFCYPGLHAMAASDSQLRRHRLLFLGRFLSHINRFLTGIENIVDVRRDGRHALKEVIDPEVGISIVELGLVKEIGIENDDVEIRMVLTTPTCPGAGSGA